jgi:flagella basal body P-ring formation protein FlgA
MRSPENGLGVTLSARTIADIVHSRYQGSVLFKGAEQVHITVRTSMVPKETLEKAFREEVIKQCPWKDVGKIEIDDVRVPNCIIVRDTGSYIIQAKFSSHEDFLGLVTANLIIGSAAYQKRVTVSGRVKLIADVPMMRTKIKTGSTISPSDIEVRTMDISSCPRALTRQEDLVGKRTKVMLWEGKPVLPSQVERKPDVCSGEMVFIEARINSLVVRDKGIALKDGYQGESIPVKNTTSGKQVVGTIIAASLVQVAL